MYYEDREEDQFKILYFSDLLQIIMSMTVKFFDLNINSVVLDPPYDFDFRDLRDDGTKYQRGGRDYKRPYGWNRVALNVKNKYESRDWFKEDGGGDWAVSYHGTSKQNAEEIAKTKYDLSKGKTFAHGRGIYSSPDPVLAEGYAKVFTFENKQYKVIIQNRVNVNMKGTDHIQSVNYFVTKEEKDIRPYALLYKKI